MNHAGSPASGAVPVTNSEPRGAAALPQPPFTV